MGYKADALYRRSRAYRDADPQPTQNVADYERDIELPTNVGSMLSPAGRAIVHTAMALARDKEAVRRGLLPRKKAAP